MNNTLFNNTLFAECLEWTPRMKRKYGDIYGRTDEDGVLLPRDTKGKDFLTEYHEGYSDGKESFDSEYLDSETSATKEEQDKKVMEWFVSSINDDDEIEHILCTGLGKNGEQTLEWHRGEA